MYSVFPASKRGAPGRVPGRNRQQGAALILALVVFGIVALLAISLSADLLVMVRRVENQLHGQQADAWMRGTEGIARNALQVDIASSNDKDHISEGWLNNPQEYPMENGLISGMLCDLQGRFNLNNLGSKLKSGSGGSDKDDQPAVAGKYSFDQELFIRLLQTLPLEEPLEQQQAEDIAGAVIDWIDADSDLSRTASAEDDYYSDLDPGYHAGNRPLVSVSELRWVKGITAEIYRLLEPHVTVLPVGTALNVNTADAAVLQSINEAKNLTPLSESDAQTILNDRDGDIASGNPANYNGGFDNIAAFWAARSMQPQTGANLVVRSDYFLLDTQAIFLDRQYASYAVIYRDAQKHIKTVARAQSGLGECR